MIDCTGLKFLTELIFPHPLDVGERLLRGGDEPSPSLLHLPIILELLVEAIVVRATLRSHTHYSRVAVLQKKKKLGSKKRPLQEPLFVFWSYVNILAVAVHIVHLDTFAGSASVAYSVGQSVQIGIIDGELGVVLV